MRKSFIGRSGSPSLDSQVRVFCSHSRPLRLPPLRLPDRVRVLPGVGELLRRRSAS